MGYAYLGAISALFPKKSSAKQLVSNYSNTLIKIAKTVNARVIKKKALES